MKRLLAAALILVMALSLFTGCESEPTKSASDTSGSTAVSGWDYVKDKGELIMGLDASFAPMGFKDDAGNIVGFDVDLANEVAAQLGIKIKLQPIDWDAKELELSSKRIDCIWNGMSITEERQKNMALSQAYMNNKIIIMGKDADKITKLDDLKGKKITTQAESSALDALKASEIYNDVKDNVTEFKSYDECILDLEAGRAELMIVDQVLGEYKNSLRDADKKLTAAAIDFGDDLYAIGCRKGETDLVAKLESGIRAAIANGKAKEISEKWFGTDLVLPIK